MSLLDDILGFFTGQKSQDTTGQTSSDNTSTNIGTNTTSQNQTNAQNTTGSQNTSTAQNQQQTTQSGQNSVQGTSGAQTQATSSLDPALLQQLQSLVSGQGSQVAGQGMDALSSILSGVGGVSQTIDSRVLNGSGFVQNAIDASNAAAQQSYNQGTQRTINGVAQQTGSAAPGSNGLVDAMNEEGQRNLAVGLANTDAQLQFQGDTLNTNAALTALTGANQGANAANSPEATLTNLVNVLKGGNISTSGASTQNVVDQLTGATSSSGQTDISSLLNTVQNLTGSTNLSADAGSAQQTESTGTGTTAGVTTQTPSILDWLNTLAKS